MKRNKKRLVAAVAVVGALAAGGAAFTASNTFNTGDIAGYASTAVSGATIADQVNNLSTDGTQITSVDLTFTASQAGNTVKAGFSDEGGLVTCTDSNTGTDTKYNCVTTNTTGAGLGGLESTAAASNFAVAVTNK
jgi:hypothetical protein